MCTWIECSTDHRPWDDVTEAEHKALSFTPVDARFEEAGPKVLPSPVVNHGDGKMKYQKVSEKTGPGSAAVGTITGPSAPSKGRDSTEVPASVQGARRVNKRRGCELSITKDDVSEVFATPRRCAAANRDGLRGGWSSGVAVSDPRTGRKCGLRGSKDQG